MYGDGFWLLFVVGGATLVTGGFVFSGLVELRRSRAGEPGTVADTAEFRELLRDWEDVVLRVRGTVREVKRFANRARFVTSLRKENEQLIREETFVGFVALEQCGLLDATAQGFDFPKWHAEEASKDSLPRGWLETAKPEDWERYRNTITGGRARTTEGHGASEDPERGGQDS